MPLIRERVKGVDQPYRQGTSSPSILPMPRCFPVLPAVVSCVAIYSVVVCPLGFSRVVMGDSGFDGFNLLDKLGSLGTAWRLLG